MSVIKFICLKCGNCCRDLLIRNGTLGLMLFQNEVALFQKRNIKPCSAIGKSLTHGSFKIITYQLTENICPHLKDNSCTIYHERPLTCKGYPFAISNSTRQAVFSTDSECTFINETKKKYGGLLEFDPGESIEAKRVGIKKLEDYYMLGNRKIRRWTYNLKTEKWERDS